MKGAKIARTEIESGLGALKVQGFEMKERFFGSVHKNFLSAKYIPFVQGGHVKDLFKFKKDYFVYDLTVLTYGIEYELIERCDWNDGS